MPARMAARTRSSSRSDSSTSASLRSWPVAPRPSTTSVAGTTASPDSANGSARLRRTGSLGWCGRPGRTFVPGRRDMGEQHRLYRALLRLYPRQFRRDYGDDLVRHFGDLVTDRGTRAAWAGPASTSPSPSPATTWSRSWGSMTAARGARCHDPKVAGSDPALATGWKARNRRGSGPSVLSGSVTAIGWCYRTSRWPPAWPAPASGPTGGLRRCG
jgi:hypothetical protein